MLPDDSGKHCAQMRSAAAEASAQPGAFPAPAPGPAPEVTVEQVFASAISTLLDHG